MRRHEGPSPKRLDWDENFKPQHTLFWRDIKICRNLRTFGIGLLDCVENNAFVAKIVNTRLTKIFMAIFAFDERLPTSATLKDGLSMSWKRLGFHCINYHFLTQYFEVVICLFLRFLVIIFFGCHKTSCAMCSITRCWV